VHVHGHGYLSFRDARVQGKRFLMKTWLIKRFGLS
jgi:hypothetical protein